MCLENAHSLIACLAEFHTPPCIRASFQLTPLVPPQELALCSLMKMIQTEGAAHQATYHGYIFPNVLFHQVVTCLLDNARDMKHLIGRFKEYLEFDDVRFYWLKNIV